MHKKKPRLILLPAANDKKVGWTIRNGQQELSKMSPGRATLQVPQGTSHADLAHEARQILPSPRTEVVWWDLHFTINYVKMNSYEGKRLYVFSEVLHKAAGGGLASLPSPCGDAQC